MSRLLCRLMGGCVCFEWAEQTTRGMVRRRMCRRFYHPC